MPYDKWGRVGYCGIYWGYVLAFTTLSANKEKKLALNRSRIYPCCYMGITL